jgi:diguanylate cyclase (GGDEF)-like protein/PAS domain S-box-containing protein
MSNYFFWKNWTITTRIGTVISIGIITSILIIVIGAVTFLKKEYLTAFGKQQFTTAQAFGMYIDADLANKLKAITAAANIMPPEILFDSSSTQKYLATRTGLITMLDDGLMILTADGRILAELPLIFPETLKKDYSSFPFFQQAQKAARPIISEPFFSPKSGHRPIIEFVAPIRNAQGIIAGYLCGGLSLNGDNALGNIARRKVGENGYFYVYSKDRTILIHHDTTRMMHKDVPVGVNRLFDLALQGFEGSGETTNSKGLNFMASFQHLQEAPWILAANLPMEEVLAPFYTTQRMIILTITICGLGVLLISWWALFRFMTPLYCFIDHMKVCGGDGVPFAHDSGPELTLLTTMFNQMLARMKESQAELIANEELQRTLLNASPDIICFKDNQGRWLLANEAILTLFQLNGVPYQGKKDAELAAYNPACHNAFLACELTDEKTWEHRGILISEETIPTPDQENRILEVIKSPLFHPDGRRKALVVIGRDITARKKNEESLRKLSKAVEQSPVSIVITDIEGNIEFVNPQFTKITGFTFAEALGKNPRILKTDKTCSDVYAQLWKTISTGRTWEGEFCNQKKNGEQFIEHAIISPIFNQNSEITHYMAIKEDITARKLSEEIIWRQANFDNLTQLPNRRLFLYRLQNAIPYTNRNKSSLALLFLDLDRFKEVNDSLGHDYGDLLLIEAARRIQACVRKTDTVARFGGDEFVLMLTNIKLDVDIGKVTTKILDALSKPFHLNNETAFVSASIGVTTCPEDSTDINTLLKNADRAMYLAKGAGRNCWRFFSDVGAADIQKEKEHHVEI